ncbi:MAG: hypothetical protein EBT92_07535 [Planctomycetes bacterium]|nr:hypothetical protein [Planctomycetota bacterium]
MEHNEKSENQTLLFITAAILAFNALILPIIGGYLENKARVLAILGIICLQVILAGINFMHIKRDVKNVWFIILPTALLCCFLIIGLLPDTIFYRQR